MKNSHKNSKFLERLMSALSSGVLSLIVFGVLQLVILFKSAKAEETAEIVLGAPYFIYAPLFVAFITFF